LSGKNSPPDPIEPPTKSEPKLNLLEGHQENPVVLTGVSNRAWNGFRAGAVRTSQEIITDKDSLEDIT
jgi:hypothetical protein